jgi:hypothetical protein
MHTRKFWKQPPAPYWRDLRAWALLIPALAATLGAIAYSVQGLAVSQGGVLPAAWVDTAVRWGAVLLGVGCEGGTLVASIEIARKRRDGDADTITLFGRGVSLDGIGIGISYAATVIARLLALRPAQASWAITLLVFASAADAYFLYNEYGAYTSIRDRSVARWQTARWWYEEQGNLPAAMQALVSDAPAALADDTRALQAQVAALRENVREGNREEERLIGVIKQLTAERDALAVERAALATGGPEAGQGPSLTATLQRTLTYYRQHPGASYAQAARDLACSRTTIRTHVDRLAAAGEIRVNGHGVEVLA